jgi:hypothetical protein
MFYSCKLFKCTFVGYCVVQNCITFELKNREEVIKIVLRHRSIENIKWQYIFVLHAHSYSKENMNNRQLGGEW